MSNKIVDHSETTRTQYTCLHSVYTVLFLLLVARDFEGCSCLVSYVAGDVAGYWPAWVKDENNKSLGGGIQCLHNITHCTNYITERLKWLFDPLLPGRSGCNFKTVISEHMLFNSRALLLKLPSCEYVNIGSANGLLLKIYDAIWCNYAVMS